ncbi:hypothetical protein B7494_g8557, partial [Chlorociboria aeruginascens]
MVDGNRVLVKEIDFHHPYTPYAIQEEFMKTVYQVLEDGSVGLLESPTGTGKSLSLICGSLTWLRDHKRKVFEEGLHWNEDVSNEPEWIIEQGRVRKRRELLRNREEMEARLIKIRAKEKAQRDRYLKGDQHYKKRKTDALKKETNDDDEEEQFILEDYNSDRESSSSATNGSGNVFSAATLELMEKLGMSTKAAEDEEEVVEDEMKIFYCSRTHSQLTQFINELRRVKFPPALPPSETTPSSSKTPLYEDLKHLTLGSRKNLCINPTVNKLGSVTAINERCLELQQPSTAKEHKCVFLPNKETQPLVNTFRDHTLASIRDIEDMGALGKEIGICPYYASRAAIKQAEIVTLPYPLLLQKSAREALGLDLKGHVVIIDEAHNIMDAISGIHGVEVSLDQLKKARAQLGVYLQKFKNKLKGKNRVYIAQVIRIIDSLTGYLEGRLALSKADGMVDEKELLSGKGVDQINFFKVIKYLQDTKLARKVESYAIHTTQNIQNSSVKTYETTTPVLHHISSLLSALTHSSNEGQLFYSKLPNAATITLKFQLLDPSPHFLPLLTDTHSILLAGGTMSPFTTFTSHLFPSLPDEKLSTLSCGHVIPPSNLLAWTLSHGPTGTPFSFTFQNRNDRSMIEELGRAILNLCSVVPDGMVVFFPSYAYLDLIIKHWSTTTAPSSSTPHSHSHSQTQPQPQPQPLMTRLSAKKPIFQESQSQSAEDVLTAYTQSIDRSQGGLLLSVVGGKMSEGINFSDRLGRCVVIVGLPYPNLMSAEWKAKLAYIETSTVSRLQQSPSSIALGLESKDGNVKKVMAKEEAERRGKEAGREFYENSCMRAVNQSIGRAIRHKNDYAAIVMIDGR